MPEPLTPSQIGHYRQFTYTPEHRRAITVARQTILEDTLEHLRKSATRRSKHHFLFIGPRGIGKSHLLSLIEDGIGADPDLSKQVVVARFPEESHRTLSFADFLLGLCDLLQGLLPDEPEWAAQYEKLHTDEDNQRIVDTLVPRIRKSNKDHQRTMVIMLENLNELFTRQIKDTKDIAAFRKFLMDANGCLLVATSPLHFDAISNVDEPFYDFFDTQLLDHLSAEQSIKLVRRNMEWECEQDPDNHRLKALLDDFGALRPKLLALYRMTAGSPRLTVMLYELIAHDSVTTVRQQLEILLDRITPYYQDRLNDLPPQERAVLETLARMRDEPKTPTAIASRMRFKLNQTGTLLKRLHDASYVRALANPEDKRSKLYTIREGFFDIWLAMNVSRTARKRLPFLLDFFALFYPNLEERNRNRKRHELATKDDSDAIACLDYLTELGTKAERRTAKVSLARQLKGIGKDEEAVQYLKESYALENRREGRYDDYLSEIEDMTQCWDLYRSGEIESFASRLLEIGGTLNFKTFSETKLTFLREHLNEIDDPEKKIQLRNRISVALLDLARWSEAEEQLQAAYSECGSNFQQTSTVLNNLASLLHDTNRPDEAEPLMRRALEIDEASFGNQHPTVAIDLNNLASLLHDTNRLDEAEPLMRRALEIDEASFGKLHPNIAIRLNNLAQLLQATNRLDEAEPLIRRALEIDEASFGNQHPTVARDLNNLAQLLQATNRLDEAEPLIRRALETLLQFKQTTGHTHPGYGISRKNYLQLLQELDTSTENIAEKIAPFPEPETSEESSTKSLPSDS